MAGSYEDLTHALSALHTKLLNLWNSTLFHVAPVHEILSFTLGAGGRHRLIVQTRQFVFRAFVPGRILT